MRKRLRMLLTLALMSSLALIALARNPPQERRPGGRRPAFSNVDKNNDGKISRDEWQGPTEVYDRIDANGDGVIAESEWDSTAPPIHFRRDGGPFAEQLLKALDADSDGSVSQAEFGQVSGYFDALDESKDGALTAGELDRFPRVITVNSRAEPEGPAGAGREMRRRPSRGGGSFLGGRLVSFLDGNADAKVSRDEFDKLAGLFGSLDADSNGVLAVTEIGRFFRALGEPVK